MSTEGQCPQCGRTLDSSQMAARVSADNLDLKKMAGMEDEKLPWHFKLLVFLLVMYLGWRVVDLFM
jgi:hypothetical protein